MESLRRRHRVNTFPRFEMLEARRLLATFYVDPTGLDTNDGLSLDTPFQTIQRAANAVQAGDTVLIRGGTYRETVTLPGGTNGTSGAKITFRPYNSERVIINGTDLVTGTWTQVSGPVYSIPWTTNFNSSVNHAFQVFIDDGVKLNEASFPQQTLGNPNAPVFLTVDSIVSSVDTGVAAPYGGNWQEVTFIDTGWTQPDGRWDGATFWYNTGGINGVSHHGAGQTGQVISSNLATNEVTVWVNATVASGVNPPGDYGFGAGTEYYVFNPTTVDGLAFDGEFWHDDANDLLYVRMPGGADPNGRTIQVKQRDWAFNLNGKSHITIANIDLFAASITTDTAAGNGTQAGNRTSGIASSNNIILDNLRATHISHFTDQFGATRTQWAQSSGIILSGSDHILRNSTIEFSAGPAVVVLGQRNQVLNNTILDAGYKVAQGGAISTGFTPGGPPSQDHKIGFNTIYRAAGVGIDITGLTNSAGDANRGVARVYHNLIHDVLLNFGSGGAIEGAFVGGNWVRIDHNVIYNVGREPRTSGEQGGIFLDHGPNAGADPARYIIDHNVVFNAASGVYLKQSHTNLVFNNTLITAPAGPGTGAIVGLGPLTNVQIRNNLSNTGYTGIGGGVTQSTNITNATDAFFVDPTNPQLRQRNYSLQPTATAAIGTGTNVAPWNDAVPVDIGAYQTQLTPFLVGATPTTPADFEATIIGQNVRLDWEDRHDGLSGFVIQRKAQGGAWQVIARPGPGSTTFLDTTTLPGVWYYYLVRGENEAGVGPVSHYEVVRRTGAGIIQLPPPSNVRASVLGPNEVRVEWSGFFFSATGFRIERKTATSAWQVVGTVAPTEREFLDTTVTEGVKYYYLVRSLGPQGAASNASNYATALPGPLLAPPTGLNATRVASGVLLNWHDASFDELGFYIQRKTGPRGRWEFLGTVTSNTSQFLDDRVVLSNRYYYLVRAYNLAGVSPPSNYAFIQA